MQEESDRSMHGLPERNRRLRRRIPRGFCVAGTFGVDSGLVWIGDPCYVLHTRETQASTISSGSPPELGRSWEEFCTILFARFAETERRFGVCGVAQFSQGVVLATGEGDGEYPILVRYAASEQFGGPPNRVQEIRVRFF